MQMPEPLKGVTTVVTTAAQNVWSGKTSILRVVALVFCGFGLLMIGGEIWQMIFEGQSVHGMHLVWGVVLSLIGLMLIWKDGDVEATIQVVGDVVVKVGGVVVRVTPWGRRKNGDTQP